VPRDFLAKKKIESANPGESDSRRKTEHSDWGRSVKMNVRVMWVFVVLAATTWLAGCGHYVCGATFGNSSCSSGGGGGNTNAGGGTYLFIADAGGIQGEVLDTTDKTMKLTGTASVSTNVPGSWMAVVKNYLYTGYPGINAIYGWSINGDGTLTGITGMDPLSVPYLSGNTQSGLQTMVANPAGTLMFVLDQASDAVHVYQIASGVLTELSSSLLTLPSGFTPVNLAMDGQGKYLFVSNIAGLATTQVAVYSLGSNNVLTAVTGSPFNSVEQQMQGESSGKFMVGTSIGTATGDQNLYVVTLSGLQSGAFTETAVPTASGFVPTSVAVQPNSGGNLVYAFDFNSLNAPAVGYTLDLTAGGLTAISGSPFSISASNGQFDPNGTYLFVVESSTGVSSSILDAYDVSTSPALANPVASVGWSVGVWQAYDAPQ